MTRLSRIHPYPAMIADDLAMELGRQFVKPGQRVLDPFCGTGRTLLAAAEFGAECVGLDINPLATFLTCAKSGNPRVDVLENFLLNAPARFNDLTVPVRDLEFGRKVEWFSRASKIELSALINWINESNLDSDELKIVAALLSATAREVSYCRQDGWKLHRISPKARKRLSASAGEVFKRRLRVALRDLTNAKRPSGSFRIITGDARNLCHLLGPDEQHQGVDLVITSPPYGDSRTTVQYGAMSGLCLGVLRHLHRLNIDVITGGEIDRRCLGGAPLEDSRSKRDPFFCRSCYWYGGLENPCLKLVRRFLEDIELSCREISKVLRRGGRAVFIVARRSIGGWRLKLDRFLIDTLTRWHLLFEGMCIREISGKIVPLQINKQGHAKTKQPLSSRVATMRAEYVMAFRKA